MAYSSDKAHWTIQELTKLNYWSEAQKPRLSKALSLMVLLYMVNKGMGCSNVTHFVLAYSKVTHFVLTCSKITDFAVAGSKLIHSGCVHSKNCDLRSHSPMIWITETSAILFDPLFFLSKKMPCCLLDLRAK